MAMGGRGESSSECKSVTSSGRTLSQDEKRTEFKGRKQGGGKSVNVEKKPDGTDSTKLTYTSEEDIYYEPGDCVYIDSQRPDVPYFICAIKEFRMSKRDSLVVVVRWYYRPSEVPESVYQLLVQDRNAENGSGDHILEDVAVKERELFISDATDVYPASALRGKCKVKPFVEIDSVKGYIQKDDAFFYVLGYNPETRRLANTKGEIRVGVSHQASLPECCPYPINGAAEEMEEPKEELVWNPCLEDYELMMYLRAARSMAQYAGMCNGGSPEDGYRAVSQDATTSNAIYVLHQNNYDAAKALQALVKKPYPKELDKKWSDDEMKKFVKGLRQYGKNFYKIKKELLPHKETGELVEYYYVWKKTPTALSSRPHRRRRHNVLRRKALPRSSKSIVSEFVDLSSCSEDDYDSDDSDRDLRLYCCRHCYSTDSRSWHHGSQNKVILCDDCRIYYKKYGKLPATDESREPPPYMFKVVVESQLRDEEGYLVNGKLALRSRRAIPPVQTTLRSGRNKTASPVEGATSESSGSNRRLAKINKAPSPSSGSSSSTGSSEGKEKLKKGKLKKGKKRRHDQSLENQTGDKRKKTRSQDSDEDANDNASDTSSTTGGRDSVAPDHDASSVCSNSSNNNDDAASNRSCSPAGNRIEAPGPVVLPDHFKRVICGEEGRSCVRTDVIFVRPRPEKPKKEPTCSRETSVSKESPSKAEANESSSSDAKIRSSTSQSPSHTPATITSHYESLRNMMSGGQYHLYPPNVPPGLSPQGIPIPAFSHQGVGMDYRMLPFSMFPGGGVIPGGESSRENAAKYAEGFEQWYAPYRLAQMQSAGHHIPAISYLQGQGRALEDSRAQAHEALLKGGSGRVLATDPVTGLQYYGPQQHSHSHLHTHFHIHPEQQHLQNLQAANMSAIDQAYLQHPGLSTWRNHPSLWQHPELLHLHGNGARGIFPEEIAHLPVHGLGSTPLDRQLQQQLIMSQQSKYYPQHMLAHEEFMRCWRQHNRAQQRLESEKINDHLLSNFFRKEHRNLQSPSQLDNVVKKSMDSSGVYSSPSKKPPVTIDLSDD